MRGYKRHKRGAGAGTSMRAQHLEMLRVDAAARLIGVAANQLQEMIEQGSGPPTMLIGKKTWIPEAALARWMEEAAAI